MKSYLQKLALSFLISNFKNVERKEENAEEILKKISILIEFLLKTDNNQYLFTVVLDCLK